MVPTVEDVFHADTNSTDDYLGEIQSMTILTAIQVRVANVAAVSSHCWLGTQQYSSHCPSASSMPVRCFQGNSRAWWWWAAAVLGKHSRTVEFLT